MEYAFRANQRSEFNEQVETPTPKKLQGLDRGVAKLTRLSHFGIADQFVILPFVQH